MNRKEFAIFNKPMYELFNYTKNTKVDSYFELPKEYPNRISSGRKPEEEDILNDRLITIPKGSEDDKNPMKKNHYEKNLFKFDSLAKVKNEQIVFRQGSAGNYFYILKRFMCFNNR